MALTCLTNLGVTNPPRPRTRLPTGPRAYPRDRRLQPNHTTAPDALKVPFETLNVSKGTFRA
jgi:hypothetical protein